MGAVKAIERRVAPLVLHEDVRELWRTVDVRSLRVDTFPAWRDPGFCLDGYEGDRSDVPGTMVPRAFLPFGYESWNCSSVELFNPETGDGGAVFDWRLDDDRFTLRYARLADWVDLVRGLIDAGRYEVRRISGDDDMVVPAFDDDAPETWIASSHVLPAHPVYGRRLVLSRDGTAWPDRWGGP